MRLKHWVDTANQIAADIEVATGHAREISARMTSLKHNLTMCVLEIEEQRESLAALGLSKSEIDALMPSSSIDFEAAGKMS